MKGIVEIDGILEAERHLSGVLGAVFDLDDTLYPEKAYVRSGFSAVAREFPYVDNMAEKLWSAFERGKPAIDEVLKAEGLSQRESKERALASYRNHKPSISLYPGVKGMLKRLRSVGYVGVVTDGRPSGQRMKVDVLGLTELVDDIIVTDELGGPQFRKPNPDGFMALQSRWEIPFEEMAYVGDNASKDFLAPLALGMKCIWFRNVEGIYN